MAASASKVQSELRESCRTIFGELLNQGGVNCHKVRADVAGKHLGITHGALGNARHVAVNTLCNRRVHFRILILGVFKVAVFALSASGLLTSFA